MYKKRIAVIGSGISGLSAAWLLRQNANITLYEAEQRFGGHSHTYQFTEGDQPLSIDTGFMVFNQPNYPLLSQLFAELDVATYPTDMSFSVSLNQGELEYAGHRLFAQRRNYLRPAFIGMLMDVLRFNRLAKQLLEQANPVDDANTLDQFLDKHRFGQAFRHDYLYPMAAAIWSCPKARIADFPVRSFVRFFKNHGLIHLRHRPQWETVSGGSIQYVNKMLRDLGPAVLSLQAVKHVQRNDKSMQVIQADGRRKIFDEVIFACHSDQALNLLANASIGEQQMLGSVPYQSNRVILHRDERLMPQRRAIWSSWNYMGQTNTTGDQSVSINYWMNSLQNLNTQRNYFVSLNPLQEPKQEHIIAEFQYEHPVFMPQSLQLPGLLKRVQGQDRVWFCGAWTGYGFHEDGLRSAVEVAQRLGAELPWNQQLQASQALVHTPWQQAA